MSFSTYSGYVNELLGFLQVSNADITTAQATSLIAVSENDVNLLLRVREMETAYSATISNGNAAIPSGYLELKFAYIEGTPTRPLTKTTPDVVYHKFPDRTNTTPTAETLVAENGNNFIFGPMGSNGDVMKGTYYAKPPSMADTQTTQPTFSAYPQVYLWGALSKAEPYIGRDPRIQTWESFFAKSLEIANGQQGRAYASGGALVAQLDTVGVRGVRR